MAYDPTLLLLVFGMFAIGLLGLVLCVLGLSWLITHPKKNGESFRRGSRRNRLASTIVGIFFIGIGVLPFTPSLF